MMAVKRISSLKIGNLMHGYRVKKITDVPDFRLTAVELTHERTKAKHVHLARDDPNKTFSVQFRTTPRDSSGVAHILEHTALCGSEHYPVRDPFFKMLTRSLATFMNAFTASDWTMYPFSSLNEKDFDNLLSVYMDAVLRPKLTEHDFMQEGWRLEHADLKDKSSPLSFKGVVYNEMKGVFSSSQNIFAQAVENGLKPVTYGVVSGGHPGDIPDLTWDQLRRFHADYYHPSNARFYTYGDMEMEKYLEVLDENYLRDFSYRQVDSAVELEPKWTQPREVVFHCPPDPLSPDPERQTTVAVNYALGDVRDNYRTFVLSLISRLLLDGDNAPFYSGLLESGLGLDWAGGAHGFDPSARTTAFSVGLQGVRDADVDAVKEKVHTIMQQVARDGFPQDRIEAALHQIELGLRHETSNFGLHLILGLSYGANHDADIEDLLQVSANVQRLRKEMTENPNLLRDIVQQDFLNNPHKLASVMKPKPEFEEETAKEEAAKLAEKTSNLKDKDHEEIMKKAQELSQMQNTKENLDCLPCLQIKDISPNIVRQPFEMTRVQQCNIQLNEAPTNGLVYLNMYFDLRSLPQDLLPYVPLFTSLFTKVGADGLTYREMSQEIDLTTGGLSADTSVCPNPRGGPEHRHGLHLASMCLHDNLPKMASLWRRLLVSPGLDDVARIGSLVQMEVSGEWASHAIAETGHAFAMRRAAASLSATGRTQELWSGLEQAALMKKTAQEVSQGQMDHIIDALRRLAAEILVKNKVKVAINSDKDGLQHGLQYVTEMLSSIQPGEHLKSTPWSIPSLSQKCHYAMPFSVNYAGVACPIVPYTSPAYASFRVLAKLMTTKYLHKEIREKGGAYGGGAVAKPEQFLFYSYRDPQSTETLNTFKEAVDWAKKTEFTEQELTEAKLAVFQELDRPIPAGQRGLSYFLTGIDDVSRQQHRDTLFQVTLDDLDNAAHDLYLKKGGYSLIGPENEELKKDDSWEFISVEE